MNLFVFGKGGCTKCLSLHIDLSLALCAFYACNITESLDSKDISEVNSGLILTNWAGSIHNFVIWENELVCERNGSIVDERSTESSQNKRVETNDGFDNFESKTKPNNTKDCTHGKVQKVIAEVIRLVGYSTDTSV